MSTKALYEGGLSELEVDIVDIAGSIGEIILTDESLREDSAMRGVSSTSSSPSLAVSAESRGTSEMKNIDRSFVTDR